MIFAITNQKGGVGKTTCTINLGACLAETGLKILLVDFDPQANCSSGLGVEAQHNTVYDALSLGHIPPDFILQTSIETLFLLPANQHLSGAEIELSSFENREYFLSRILDSCKTQFDIILIDCPPSLGLLTVNALCTSDAVCIPLQCEYFALEGMSHLLKNISTISETLNKNLFIFGIILTLYDGRTRLARDVVEEVVSVFKEKVFDSVIPRNIKIAEAPSFGKPITIYDNTSIGYESYKALTKEFILRWQNHKNV